MLFRRVGGLSFALSRFVIELDASLTFWNFSDLLKRLILLPFNAVLFEYIISYRPANFLIKVNRRIQNDFKIVL